MKRIVIAILVAAVAAAALPAPGRADVSVRRESDENPMVEISRSILYGGLAGLMVGGAIAWATESDDAGEILRWSFVGGTMVGLVAGVAFAARRPQPTSLLELDAGELRVHAPPTVEPAPGGARAHLVGLRF